MRRFVAVSVLAALALGMVVVQADGQAQTRLLPAVAPGLRQEARRLHLPAKLTVGSGADAQTFRLQRIVRARSNEGLDATGHQAQALYVSGDKTVSVFVSNVKGGNNAQLVPPAGGTWTPLALGDGRTAFMHSLANAPHSAVVWVGRGHRYTAIARLPLTDLSRLARAMARPTATALTALSTP